MTRVFTGPRGHLFQYFAESQKLAQWWGPIGFSIPGIDFTPRQGASYRIQMQPPEGEAFALTGIFRDVDAPSRLVFTFAWQPPDPDDVETVARLDFENLGESTAVRLRQGSFATEARRNLHRAGWADSFDKLAHVLGAHS